MVNISRFIKQGKYIRSFDAVRKKDIYYFLSDREGPKVYPSVFSELAVLTKQTDATVFKEINPADGRILQALIGFYPGAKFYIFHEKNKKILMWDESIENIAEDDTGWLDYTISSPEDPRFSLWLEHDKYPGFQPKNTSPRDVVLPKIVIFGMEYSYVEVTDPTELEKLRKRYIRSEPVLLGRGAIVA